MERLDKILAGTGLWSRREVKLLIRAGRVTVNGAVAAGGEEKYDREAVALAVDGQPVYSQAHVYLMLHKPPGLLSATEDRNRPTVMELLPPHLRKLNLFPVGRLDKDTEGLLLLTNDGPLAHQLLSPGKHVDKVYFVRVDGVLNDADRQAFQNGMVLDGETCLPAELAPIPPGDTGLVTLREGKYHQVKRMLAARGKPVLYLKRMSMGPLQLDPDLPLGQWRYLRDEEQASLLALRGAAGGTSG